MKISTTWLQTLLRRTMLDNELVTALERSGIEIEQYSSSTPLNKNIVVGLVKKVIQHPGADRLKIATVDDGREELTIVCGAPNIYAGMKAPLARIGAILPDGMVISPAKLRGETSYGMLCSPRELGLSDSHEGLLDLGADSEVGKLLCDIYPSDGFVDVKTAANRFDLLGAIGVAREVAAMADAHLVLPPVKPLPKISAGMIGSLDAACPQFAVAELTLDPASPSPDWIVARLAVAGIRSLGLVVDITNYVMIETAQPLHAYDADKVSLPFGLRKAKTGETLITLDDQKRQLDSTDLVVTDATGTIGLAGVRGGARTEFGPQTKRIYLEAATFEGALIRQTAKRYNLRTDASARFERGLPPEAAVVALARAVALLEEFAKAELIRWSMTPTKTAGSRNLRVTAAHASKIMGIPVTPAEIVASLERLEIKATSDGDEVTATLPWWRPDLKEAEDLIEETVRVIGYDKIPSTIPAWRPRKLTFDRTRPALGHIRNLLSGAGLFEVMTYSFVSAEQLEASNLTADKHLKLKNPLSIEQAYLRTTLLPSHLAVAARNRMYAKKTAFYELSNVFEPKADGEQPNERMLLSIMVTQPKGSYAFAKGILDALARSLNVSFEISAAHSQGPWAEARVADVILNGEPVGRIGQLSPSLVQSVKLVGEAAAFELQLAPLLAASRPAAVRAASRFPEAQRDITVLVPEQTQWQDVAAALAGVSGLEATFMSDYVNQAMASGYKSLSIHLRLSSNDHTPTDAESSELETKVRSILQRLFKALPEK
ncbi:phenylalanine--tRNA ligase subunit beta [Candidatus Saccharibacteria bacterium]|nr:phenylalanine--tRNA ligase subunit beta [Candidatus Saccharibacteria bacterium]